MEFLTVITGFLDTSFSVTVETAESIRRASSKSRAVSLLKMSSQIVTFSPVIRILLFLAS